MIAPFGHLLLIFLKAAFSRELSPVEVPAMKISRLIALITKISEVKSFPKQFTVGVRFYLKHVRPFLVAMSALFRISLLSNLYICLLAGVAMAGLFRIALLSHLYSWLGY